MKAISYPRRPGDPKPREARQKTLSKNVYDFIGFSMGKKWVAKIGWRRIRESFGIEGSAAYIWSLNGAKQGVLSASCPITTKSQNRRVIAWEAVESRKLQGAKAMAQRGNEFTWK